MLLGAAIELKKIQGESHPRAEEVEGTADRERLQECDLQGEGSMPGGDPQLLQGGQLGFVIILGL